MRLCDARGHRTSQLDGVDEAKEQQQNEVERNEEKEVWKQCFFVVEITSSILAVCVVPPALN